MRKIFKKKGNVTLFIVFLFLATIMILLAAVIVPILIRQSTTFYVIGQGIINDSMQDINNITNVAIRTQINQSLTAAQQSTADNIDILSYIFRYSWVLILIVLGIVGFIATRRQVETGGGLA